MTAVDSTVLHSADGEASAGRRVAGLGFSLGPHGPWVAARLTFWSMSYKVTEPTCTTPKLRLADAFRMLGLKVQGRQDPL